MALLFNAESLSGFFVDESHATMTRLNWAWPTPTNRLFAMFFAPRRRKRCSKKKKRYLYIPVCLEFFTLQFTKRYAWKFRLMKISWLLCDLIFSLHVIRTVYLCFQIFRTLHQPLNVTINMYFNFEWNLQKCWGDPPCQGIQWGKIEVSRLIFDAIKLMMDLYEFSLVATSWRKFREPGWVESLSRTFFVVVVTACCFRLLNASSCGKISPRVFFVRVIFGNGINNGLALRPFLLVLRTRQFTSGYIHHLGFLLQALSRAPTVSSRRLSGTLAR